MDLIMTSRLAMILLATAACIVPTPWISLPAAAILVLWLPGRSLLCLLPGLESLRTSKWAMVAASAALMPVPLSWAWRLTNARWAIVALVCGLNLVLAVAVRKDIRPREAPPASTSRRYRLLLAAMTIWTSGCVFLSFWLPSQVGNVTITRAHDYVKHHAVMLSLERHPLPLHSCFYRAEADTPYYYYEYYYLLPAALRTMTGNKVSIPLAFGLTSALLAAILIHLTSSLAGSITRDERCSALAAAFVSLVGGFDIVPVLIRAATGGSLVVTLDAWCPVAWRVHNFTTQYFWCPQHVFAVVGLTLAAIWLRLSPRGTWWLLMAPLLSASIFGGSAHLAIVIFPAAAVYAVLFLWRIAREDRTSLKRVLAGIVVIGVLGLALMGRQAWGYKEMSSRYPGGLTTSWERFPFAIFGRLLPAGPLANYADAPWLLIVELGLPALACLLVSGTFWRVLWADPGVKLLILVGLSGAVLMFTFRSEVNAIDYGFRIAPMAAAPLLAGMAGSLLNADLLRRRVRRIGVGLAVIGASLGLPVGLYEAPLTAVRTIWESRRLMPESGAIRFLRESTPTDAVIQGDPDCRLDLAALTDRRIGASKPNSPHVVVFSPKDPASMRRAYSDVMQAFYTPSSEEAHAKLETWGVRYVFVGLAERKRFGIMPQFNDQRWFEPVYNGDGVTVYRLADLFSQSRPEVITQRGGP
ncbi:MAG TPA: hypothetical protein PLL20_09685 [Phycisphaerae bacterium]|nr:hypothetical protein [Phycisphaerae bacterium]HRR84887.1 hypothetical protein [Phycisphaerae bacterium]